MTHAFALFDLPQKFEIDLAQLEKTYFALQKQHHPDQIAFSDLSQEGEKGSPPVLSSTINEAYGVLKDPAKRAALLLTLRGVGLPPEGESFSQDADILMESLELRELLEGMESPAELMAFREKLQALFQEAQEDFSRSLEALALEILPHHYRRLLYLSKILEAVKQKRQRLTIKVMEC